MAQKLRIVCTPFVFLILIEIWSHLRKIVQSYSVIVGIKFLKVSRRFSAVIQGTIRAAAPPCYSPWVLYKKRQEWWMLWYVEDHLKGCFLKIKTTHLMKLWLAALRLNFQFENKMSYETVIAQGNGWHDIIFKRQGVDNKWRKILKFNKTFRQNEEIFFK